jgi:hypothetical protein
MRMMINIQYAVSLNIRQQTFIQIKVRDDKQQFNFIRSFVENVTFYIYCLDDGGK